MPTRLIREGINSSARVNCLSLGAEVLYRRLMSVADDYGRFYASPATLRGACWPTAPGRVSEDDIAEWLEECMDGDRPLVILYESGGCAYLQITDFNQQTRSKSKFPEFAGNPLTNAKQLLSTCAQNVRTIRSRNSETKSNAETEADKTPVAKTATAVIPITNPADPIEDWFNREFWPLYPRHTARKESLKAARAHLKSEDTRKAAMFGLNSQVPELRSRDPSKIPHAATWINGRRWEDEPSPLFAAPKQKSFMSDVESVMRSRVERGMSPL